MSDQERWYWDTRTYNAGWSSRVLLSTVEPTLPILGVSSSACSWRPSEAHEKKIQYLPALLSLARRVYAECGPVKLASSSEWFCPSCRRRGGAKTESFHALDCLWATHEVILREVGEIQ